MEEEYNEKVFSCSHIIHPFIHPFIHSSCMVSWWVLVHILAKNTVLKIFCFGKPKYHESSNAMFLSAICQLHFCFFCAGTLASVRFGRTTGVYNANCWVVGRGWVFF
jgi:hypothetical protein